MAEETNATIKIKKSHLYIALGLIVILGVAYIGFSIGTGNSSGDSRGNGQQTTGMAVAGPTDAMASHHAGTTQPAGDSMASHHGNSAPIPDLGEKISFAQAVGSKAPDFTLQTVDGITMKLSDFRTKKNVILFFNEGAMCYPACWNQMAALASAKDLNNAEVVSLSIVADQKQQWETILKKVPKLASATILIDNSKAVSNAYDSLNTRSSMHKGSYPGHTFFIIDKEGVIRYALDDPDMAIRNDELIAALKTVR